MPIETSDSLPSFLAPLREVPLTPIIATAGDGLSAEVTGTSKHLSLSMSRPAPTEWCWAATTAAVASFYATVHGIGQALPACQVATICLLEHCCPEPTDPKDARNKEYALQGALNALGRLAGDPIPGALDFATIVEQVNLERPICCHIAWDPSNPDNGHFNAIVGYDSGNQDVDICDCLYGNQTLPYSIFCKAYQGEGRWDWTYLTI